MVHKKLNFNAFRAVPENHNLWYHRGGEPCKEFESYFNFNINFASPLSEKNIFKKSLSQFIVILPNDAERFYLLKKEIEFAKIAFSVRIPKEIGKLAQK